MQDYIVRATAGNDEVRAFAITSREMVEKARRHHGSSPVVTAALGRMLSAASMMGTMMKGDKDLLTLQAIGDGPMQGITVTSNSKGTVKGFPNVANVEVPDKYEGKLDVGAALGNGFLRVIRDTGLKEPYVGTVQLQTGEIAEDLTYYFAQSEQTPSAVGLGVLVDTDCSVSHAGGFIVQLMPDTSEHTINQLEFNIRNLETVTKMLSLGLTPEEMLDEVLLGLDHKITDRVSCEFKCDCSKERITRSLATINPADIDEMIEDGKPIEVRCEFCNSTYEFSVEDLEAIRSERRAD